MSKFGKEPIESLNEAAGHAEGNVNIVRLHIVEVPDVRAGGVATLKLCNDCFEVRRDSGDPFVPISSPD